MNSIPCHRIVETKESDYADIVSMPCVYRIIFTYKANEKYPSDALLNLCLRCHYARLFHTPYWVVGNQFNFLLLFPTKNFFSTHVLFFLKKISISWEQTFLGESSFFSMALCEWGVMIPLWCSEICSITSQNHHWVE